ncbi:MAG: trigger factor [bacterium]|nr:trigger factor [bacterium]
MKVEWRREPPSRAVLEVEVPAEEVDGAVRAATARLSQRVKVPGFRKGKTPRAMLERYIGRDELYDEAMGFIVASAYPKALEETGVVPVGRPEIEAPSLDEGSSLRFTATVDIYPEVDLGAYDEVRVPFEPKDLAETEVDAAIEDLRRRRGRLVSAPGVQAAAGDFVLIRPMVVEGTDRFHAGREVLVEMGAGVFPREVEEALSGASAGEERSAAIGEGGRLVATVTDVKRRELPDLDEAFARAVGDVATVDELRDLIRERLAAGAAAQARETHEEQVLTGVLERATIELPASLVEREIEHLLADLQESLQRRGYSLDRHLQTAGKDLAGLREELRPRAERRLKARHVLDEIVGREGVAPTQEEIAAEEEKVAAELQQDLARVREWLATEGRRETMLAMLRRRKTISTLVDRERGWEEGREPA